VPSLPRSIQNRREPAVGFETQDRKAPDEEAQDEVAGDCSRTSSLSQLRTSVLEELNHDDARNRPRANVANASKLPAMNRAFSIWPHVWREECKLFENSSQLKAVANG